MYGECWAYVILTILLLMKMLKMWKKTDIFICCESVGLSLC